MSSIGNFSERIDQLAKAMKRQHRTRMVMCVAFWLLGTLAGLNLGHRLCERTHSGMEAIQDVAVDLQEGPSTRTSVTPALVAERPSPVLTTYTVTAYDAGECCCYPYADGITASGEPVTANGGKFVAAPDNIPFGTMLRIPGYGTVPVLDRGGSIEGNRLDVFFGGANGHRDALNWGVKELLVERSH